MRLLICGDSFSADWTVKTTQKGWVNDLADLYDVTNLSQAGCSEYKIYQQLISQDLKSFDKIIVSHTSPNRLYVKEHPIHKNDSLHKNSDLIYTDLKYHSDHNPDINPIIEYFEKYFDTDYAAFVHGLICEKIDAITRPYKVLHIANLFWDDLYQFDHMKNFYWLFKKYRGDVNHYNVQGNQIIFDEINSWITGN